MTPSEQMERQSPDKKLFVSADTNVPLHVRRIFVTGGSPPPDLTFPNVSEAEGVKFVVSALTVPATTDAAVNIDHSDGTGDSGISISTTGVEVELESDGINWIVSRA